MLWGGWLALLCLTAKWGRFGWFLLIFLLVIVCGATLCNGVKSYLKSHFNWRNECFKRYRVSLKFVEQLPNYHWFLWELVIIRIFVYIFNSCLGKVGFVYEGVASIWETIKVLNPLCTIYCEKEKESFWSFVIVRCQALHQQLINPPGFEAMRTLGDIASKYPNINVKYLEKYCRI